MTVLVAIYSPIAAWNIPEAVVAGLRARHPRHRFLHARDEAEALALAPEAEVCFAGEVTPALLARAPRLRWIHSPAAGVGHMLFPELLARGVVITNSRGLHAEPAAEHVLAVVLALFRRLHTAVRRQAEHRWAQDEISAPPGPRRLRGALVGIVGLGAIGSAVARLVSAAGARVEAVRRRPERPAPPGVAVYPAAELHARLPHWDVVVLCAPLTRETRRLIDARALALMKRDAVLVNVGRGRLVDEAALAAALAEGRLGGAALDVFEREPLAPDSPLWDLPNVLVTPHVSGFRADYWEAAVALFEENLRRDEAGEPLLNVVDQRAGY